MKKPKDERKNGKMRKQREEKNKGKKFITC